MRRWLLAFYFFYRVTDTTTGALIDRGISPGFPDQQECVNQQAAWHRWMTTPRLDPKTKTLLPPDSVEMTGCEPWWRLDKMPR